MPITTNNLPVDNALKVVDKTLLNSSSPEWIEKMKKTEAKLLKKHQKASQEFLKAVETFEYSIYLINEKYGTAFVLEDILDNEDDDEYEEEDDDDDED